MRFAALLRTGVWVLSVLAVGVGGSLSAQAQQQKVPDSLRKELEARNLTPEQARRQARQLGIDLSTPERSTPERAGGVTPNGYPGGGQLVREGERFILDIQNVLRGTDDLELKGGDRIVIPAEPNSVSVRGNVAQEGRIKYQDGRDVEYYLERAGGVRDSTKNVYLTQASGATVKVSTGWFSRSPEVTDGAVIRVTREQPTPDEESVDIGQVVTDVTGIVSSALTIIVLATRAFD